VYGVVLEAGERAVTKPCEPLRAVEVANLSSWIDRLNGALDAPPEPLPPAELQPPPAPLEAIAPAPVQERKARAPKRSTAAAQEGGAS